MASDLTQGWGGWHLGGQTACDGQDWESPNLNLVPGNFSHISFAFSSGRCRVDVRSAWCVLHQPQQAPRLIALHHHLTHVCHVFPGSTAARMVRTGFRRSTMLSSQASQHVCRAPRPARPPRSGNGLPHWVPSRQWEARCTPQPWFLLPEQPSVRP